MRKDSWLVPLTGALFVVLLIVGFMVGGEPPDVTDDSTAKIVDFYTDNKNAVIVGAVLAAIAGTLFVFFGGYLRQVLLEAEGPGGILSSVAFAGMIIFAAGIAIDSTISFALADTADDIDPAAAQALMALYNYDFLVFAMGLQIFLLATGLSVLRHGALPKWIGAIAIVLAVIAVTPIGFAAFLGTGLLILLISVMLALQERRGKPLASRP
jgi:hypothetical protein